MKGLFKNYHALRVAIIEFIKVSYTSSQYFTPIEEGLTQNALIQMEDSSLPTRRKSCLSWAQTGKCLIISLYGIQSFS